MERKHKDIKVHMVNTFRSVEHTTVYSYLNATINAMISGQTQFVDEYLLDPVDGRSSNAVLRCGKVCKGDMVLFNLDDRGRRALGEVKGFVQSEDLVFAHVIQFAPCSRTSHKRWDTSRKQETIVDARSLIAPVPYRIASESTVRIIVPVLLG